MIHANATDVRFAVYVEREGKTHVLTHTNTARGAKVAVTRRERKGEFALAKSYGWERLELVNGEWVTC